MFQTPKFPCLPGFNFDHNIGRTKFNRSQQFDRVHDDVYYLADKPKLDTFSRYPATYAWGEEPPAPTWLTLDGQRLKFKAYFQDSIHEGREPYRVRFVDISFFLEDGTMKVSERPIENSGLEQGILVKRQRIPLPDPVKYRYYDILDLNVGGEPKIFGRVYKIIDCDKFTRHFLNRMGIAVPDPIDSPDDPERERIEREKAPKTPMPKKDPPLKNFLRYDKKILRFYGYWDDSERDFGYVHDLEILYHLADDTMEVVENVPVACGPKERSLIVKKMKIPKFFTEMEPIGSSEPKTLLNVVGENVKRAYYITDHSPCHKASTDCYRDCDLTIGAQLNIFGRKVIITDLDPFTKEYYRKKYGLDDFTPLDRPDRPNDKSSRSGRYIPPYNGHGSYEDSLSNCLHMVPKRPKVPTDKFFQYENQWNDNRVLRYGAKMISDIPENKDRFFVLNVYLFDGTIAIVEASKDSGHTKSLFQKRMLMMKPGQDVFVSERPNYYGPSDFYVGANLVLNGFRFVIETADEYTFNYMEQHYNEFPKADVKMILNKIRKYLKPVYREFLNEYTPLKSDDLPPIIRLSCLREAMRRYVGDSITEHETITLARHYSKCERKELYPRERVRAMVHMELLRYGFNQLERLEEDCHAWDRDRTGHLDRHQLYTILRAIRIPLSVELIHLMLERLNKDEQGRIDYNDLIKFINLHVNPVTPLIPMNVKALYWTPEEKPKNCEEIDWSLFLKDLDLEEELDKAALQTQNQ
ncbi:hypothetical protein QAD02_016365 [Eretmocerus hayati]|uniref:Uncharacterized protein n=1 Tax=Eretmocerus hayati TaxID=131215 RepID=A0ACC2PBV5_9HYME|nr:hypothetical protein QAD02_016365 [Eretmocerus hayati]